jgi:hypothetical protein
LEAKRDLEAAHRLNGSLNASKICSVLAILTILSRANPASPAAGVRPLENELPLD